MNATNLYTQLSRKVMLLNKDSNDVLLSEFMRSDMGFLKLRTLLLCRSCRELCFEPFSSDFCHHLTCKQCIKEKKSRYPSCKWCRNTEDLVADFQSKILIASYKKLCAILRDFVTGYVNNDKSGPSPTKIKLLRFLNEGCSSPDILFHQIDKGLEKTRDDFTNPVTKLSKAIQTEISPERDENSIVCPPCCCTCDSGDIKGNANISESIGKIISVDSSGNLNEDKLNESPDYRSDTVSSTVPDTIPVSSVSRPDTTVENKHEDVYNDDGLSSGESCIVKIEPRSNFGDNFKNDNTGDAAVSSCGFYDALSSISLKERQNRSIFEKFGLALSPTPNKKLDHEQSSLMKGVEKHRRKKHSKGSVHKDRKKKESRQMKQKLQPLKLKVRKVNSYNSGSGYSVQYNISNGTEKNEVDVNNCMIHNSKDLKKNKNIVHNTDIITVPDSPEPEIRKHKRKATFISNYAIFSDESDYESGFYFPKRSQKVVIKKDRGEACSCGSGSKVKYFTNICRRSRCPCFSQERACVNCKCRFCSNPYLMDNQVDEMFTDSDSANEQTPLTYWLKDETEVIDVESM